MPVPDGPADEPLQSFQGPALVPVEMALGVEDDAAPSPAIGVHAQRRLLGHRAARQVDGRRQPQDPGDLGLEVGDHPAVAVAVHRSPGRDRREQGVGAGDAVAGQGSLTGVAQSAQVVVHPVSVRDRPAPTC